MSLMQNEKGLVQIGKPENLIRCEGGVMALPLVTSHSLDGTFHSCQRRFEFAHVYQQQPESGSVGMAAEVGTALHEAIQRWATIFLHPGAERTDSLRMEAEDAAIYTLMEWWPWITEILAIKQKSLAASQRNLPKSLRLLFSVIRHDFWNDYELATLPDGSPAIEIPWRVVHHSRGVHEDPLGRPRVLVTQGKIDFVLRNRVTKTIKVWDLKTTNKAPNLLDGAYRFSGQALGYSFILGSAMNWDFEKHGIDVTYLVASFLDFNIYPKHYRIPYDEVLDYLTTRNDLLDSMVRNLERQWWPRTQHGCDSYGTVCSYMDICQRRDPRYISAWFADDQIPFAERTRIYETLWTFND